MVANLSYDPAEQGVAREVRAGGREKTTYSLANRWRLGHELLDFGLRRSLLLQLSAYGLHVILSYSNKEDSKHATRAMSHAKRANTISDMNTVYSNSFSSGPQT